MNPAYNYIPEDIPIPGLYDSEKTPIQDKMIYIKLFTPDSSWTWYLAEYDPADQLGFGYCDSGRDAEWGYVSLEEITSVTGPLGLPIERDIHFSPKPFGEIKKPIVVEDTVEFSDDEEPPVPQFSIGDEVSLIRQVGTKPYNSRGTIRDIGGYVPEYLIEFGDHTTAWCPESAVEVAKSGLIIQEPPPPTHPAHGLQMKPQPAPKRQMVNLPQEYVGKLPSGVFCYGLALHNTTVIYINMAGPRVATESIRATLMNNGVTRMVLPDEEVLNMGGGGKYVSFDSSIPEARVMSTIVCSNMLVSPDVDEWLYFLGLGNRELKLVQALRQILHIAIFDHWAVYLWAAGEAAKLIEKMAGYPQSVDIYGIKVDPERWQSWVTAGIASGKIQMEAE